MATNYQKLADALITALKSSTDSGLANIDIQRRNFGEDTMNRANARGTLYSTSPAYIKSREDAAKFLPASAKLREGYLVGKLGIKTNLLDTQQRIQSLNRAAKELGKMSNNYFDSLLT